MPDILLADNFPLPPAAVTESIFIGGRKGSGKTNTGQLLFEQMVGIGAQCVALDPVGNWYSLRLSASGKRGGARRLQQGPGPAARATARGMAGGTHERGARRARRLRPQGRLLQQHPRQPTHARPDRLPVEGHGARGGLPLPRSMMFDIDFHPERTPEQLAEYLRNCGSKEDLAELARLLSAEAGVQRQSGMEGKHEAWVLATLNFLNAMDIPVWNHDARGNRLKHDKEIPERLNLVSAKFKTLTEDRNRLSKQFWEQVDKNERVVKQLDACHRLLGEVTRTTAASLPQDLKDRLLDAFPEFRDYFATPPATSEPAPESPPDPPSS